MAMLTSEMLKSDRVRSLSSIAFLLVVYLVGNECLMRASRLPGDFFHEPVLLFAYFKNLLRHPIYLVFSLVALCPLLLNFRKLPKRWSDLEQGGAMRVIVVVSALALSWPFITADFNLYLNQEHLFDRVVVIGCVVLLFLRPVFVIPLLISVLPLIAQRNEPLGYFTWTTHLLPIRILILFTSMYLLSMFSRRNNASSFMFLLLCFVASHYAVPGLFKLKEGWLFAEQSQLLVPTRYATGCTRFLNEELLGPFSNFVARVDLLFKILVICLETGSFLIIAGGRRTAIALLCIWSIFHLAVATLSGILFWQWVMIDVSIAWVLWKAPGILELPIFSRANMLVSLVLIGTSHFWLHPPPLFWIDTPLIYTYRLEGLGESGRRFNLPTSLFGDYNFEMKLFGFSHLEREQKLLNPVWGGVWTYEEAMRCRDITTPEAALAHEHEYGTIRYDKEKTERTRELFRVFFRNYELRGSRASTFSWFKAPPILWLTPLENDYAGQEPITEVNVFHVFSLWDGDRLRLVRERPLLSVEIPRGTAPDQDETDE